MKTLYQAIEANAGKQAPALLKHLSAASINDWADLTKGRLFDFRDGLTSSVASSSAKTYLAVLKAVISRYSEDVDIPCKDFSEALKVRADKPLKTFLSADDLTKLEKVTPCSDVERYTLNEFLVSAYTGMRISDVLALDLSNVQGEFLSYVSIKTHTHAIVPLRPGMLQRIEWLQNNRIEVSLMGYNKAIRRLCQRAGIDEQVKVFKAGKALSGPKYKFVSSHTGRISFCTCLASLGAGIEEIKKMAGHSNITMTERYIVPDGIEISQKAMAFFR